MRMAKRKTNKNEGGGVFADINITPLTDIFLVLLIIFMVTTAVTIESAAHVDLPKASAPTTTTDKPKGNIVTYTAEHLVYLNDKQVTEGELVPQLHDALQNSTDKNVIFQGDPKVILGDMVRILDLAKSAGADQIAIAVSSLPPGGGAGVNEMQDLDMPEVPMPDSAPQQMEQPTAVDTSQAVGLANDYVRAAGGGGIGIGRGGGMGSGYGHGIGSGFGGFIGELRRKGLDVVIVIDGTGSMKLIIDRIKTQKMALNQAVYRIVPISRIRR